MTMASLRKRGRVWYYRYVDADGVKHEGKGCPDSRETEEMAAHAEAEAARVRAGLSDPKAEARRHHAGRTLADHLADLQAHLDRQGEHRETRRALRRPGPPRRRAGQGGRLAEIDPPQGRRPRPTATGPPSRWTGFLASARLADLTPTPFKGAGDAEGRRAVRWRPATITGPPSGRSRRWAWRRRPDGEDALAGVTGFNAKEDRRHDRRTLGLDELRRLIDGAHARTDLPGDDRPARALCYRLAVATGLRFSEIKSIRPGSFDLTSDPATVTVAAGYTKNGDPATLPLPRRPGRRPGPVRRRRSRRRPVFPLPDQGADMLKVDLAAAGIPYRDGAGPRLRLPRPPVPVRDPGRPGRVTPRVVQKLMRHSTLELTGRYTRPRMLDIEAAAGSLPAFGPARPGREAAAATGTDGTHKRTPCPPFAQRRGRNGAGPVGCWRDRPTGRLRRSMGRNPLDGRDLDGEESGSDGDCRE